MKKIALILTIVLSTISIQSEKLIRLSIENQRKIDDTYHVDVMVEPVATNWNLGNCTIVIEFNEEALSVANFENVKIYNFDINSKNDNYKIDQTEYNQNMVSLNIFNMSPNHWVEEKVKIGTLTFDILDGDLFDGLKFVTDETEVYDNWKLLRFNSLTTNGYTIVNPANQRINDISTSVVDNSNIMEISPQPVVDNLNIEIPTGEKSIEIRDMKGKLMLELTTDQAIESIDVSDFSNGTYFITITTENQIFTEKFVKMK